MNQVREYNIGLGSVLVVTIYMLNVLFLGFKFSYYKMVMYLYLYLYLPDLCTLGFVISRSLT